MRFKYPYILECLYILASFTVVDLVLTVVDLVPVRMDKFVVRIPRSNLSPLPKVQNKKPAKQMTLEGMKVIYV